MKVRRKTAKPYNGEHIPYKLAVWMKKNPGHKIPTGTAEPSPICNAVRWMRHGDHPQVKKVSDTHGMVTNMGGHLSVVSPGEHIIEMPDGGLVHHRVQDISRWYDIL